MPLFALSFFLSTVNSKYVFNGPNPASFCLYSSFSQYNENSVDGVLGTWTRGSRMVGADESTELSRDPKQ